MQYNAIYNFTRFTVQYKRTIFKHMTRNMVHLNLDDSHDNIIVNIYRYTHTVICVLEN